MRYNQFNLMLQYTIEGKTHLKILIIIPTYNESENLPLITAALLALPVLGLSVLIVDDNSPDGTGQLADDLAQQNTGRMFVLHRTGKLGLGTAYITGFKYGLANGYDVIGQMDADFSHPVDKVPVFLNALQGSVELAIGSRYIPGGSLDEAWPAWRKFLSGFGNFYARTILRLPIRDVTGGFRLWKRSLLARMPLDAIRSNGYIFQVEMAYVAYLLGAKYREIPFYFADRKLGRSKMSAKIQVEAAINVWRLLNIHKHIRLLEEK
jgi:dolichol-phosphate mannosyltransferase